MGKGLHPPAGMQWKPGPTTTLLGPAPSSVPGAAFSGLFKLLFTVAYIEGLGLDTSPARGHEETGLDGLPRRRLVLGPSNFTTTSSLSFPHFGESQTATVYQKLLGVSLSEILTGGGTKYWQESAF